MLPSRRPQYVMRSVICATEEMWCVWCIWCVWCVMCVCVCVCLFVCVCVRHVKTSQNILFVIVHHLFQEISLIDDTTMKTLPKLRKLLPEQDPCAFTQEAFFQNLPPNKLTLMEVLKFVLRKNRDNGDFFSFESRLVQWNSGTHSLFPVLKRLRTCPEIPLASLIASTHQNFKISAAIVFLSCWGHGADGTAGCNHRLLGAEEVRGVPNLAVCSTGQHSHSVISVAWELDIAWHWQVRDQSRADQLISWSAEALSIGKLAFHRARTAQPGMR